MPETGVRIPVAVLMVPVVEPPAWQEVSASADFGAAYSVDLPAARA
jgi:hypothetical protein